MKTNCEDIIAEFWTGRKWWGRILVIPAFISEAIFWALDWIDENSKKENK